MKRTNSGLWVTRLNQEQHLRTCGYWYTVTTSYASAHTAFATRAGLDRYLAERGLQLTSSLDEPGCCQVVGSYREESHISEEGVAAFPTLVGLRTRALSNGHYVEAVITDDEDGIKTVHTLNPNVKDRKVFDYRESRQMMS